LSQDEEDDMPVKSLFDLPGNETFKPNVEEFKSLSQNLPKPQFSRSTNLPSNPLFTFGNFKIPSFVVPKEETKESPTV
jgi:hypothetical protein